MALTITHKYLRDLLENLSDENHDEFLIELQYSTLIVPVYKGMIPSTGNLMPLFTDIHEFNKFNKNNEYRPIAHFLNHYLEFFMEKQIEGFAINPESESFLVSEEILHHMQPNYIFDQEYQVFTAKQIKKMKESINNRELNGFIEDVSNRWDLTTITQKLNGATLLTLLVSDEPQDDEVGVIPMLGRIPRCLYELGGKNYILLFSREVTMDSITRDVHTYSQIVNFSILVEELLNHDFDGFILNIDGENITIPRQYLRDFMKGFKIPLLDDYSMYAFTIPGGD